MFTDCFKVTHNSGVENVHIYISNENAVLSVLASIYETVLFQQLHFIGQSRIFNYSRLDSSIFVVVVVIVVIGTKFQRMTVFVLANWTQKISPVVVKLVCHVVTNLPSNWLTLPSMTQI